VHNAVVPVLCAIKTIPSPHTVCTSTLCIVFEYFISFHAYMIWQKAARKKEKEQGLVCNLVIHVFMP